MKILLILLISCSTAWAEVPEWYHPENRGRLIRECPEGIVEYDKLDEWMRSIEERLIKIEHSIKVSEEGYVPSSEITLYNGGYKLLMKVMAPNNKARDL